jgi:hypothetical protein
MKPTLRNIKLEAVKCRKSQLECAYAAQDSGFVQFSVPLKIYEVCVEGRKRNSFSSTIFFLEIYFSFW